MEHLSIDLETYRKLKARYERAVAHQEESFTFQGHELLTAYAKYLLQYLETTGGFK